MTPSEPLAGNLALLHQGLSLLQRIGAESYRTALPDRSSVGAQYRHLLDHYRALVDGVPAGLVDYDARRRSLEVETDHRAAATDTRDLIDRMATLAHVALETPLAVVASPTAAHAGEPQPSSLGRELLFLVSHTVHHYAIIRLLLDNPEAVDQAFGVAPSTLAWERTAG